MYKKIALVCFKEEVKEILNKEKKPEFISIGYNAYRFLDEIGLENKYYDFDFGISLKDYKKIKKEIKKFKNKVERIKLSFPIDISSKDQAGLFETAIRYYYYDAFKIIVLLNKILNKEKPKEIICTNYPHYRSKIALACSKKIVNNTKEISVKYNEPIIKIKSNLEDYLKEGAKTIAGKPKLGEFLVLTDDPVLALKICEKNKYIKPSVILPNWKLTLWNKLINSNKAKFHFIENYIKEESRKKIIKSAEDNWKIIFEELNEFEVEGIKIMEIIQNEFRELFYNEFIESILYISAIQEINSEKEINFTLLRQDVDTLPKAIAIASQRFNIPSLVVQHGGITPYDQGMKDSKEEIQFRLHGYYPLTCDKMAVWGKWPKKYINSAGVENNRLVITGSPKFDEIIEKKTSSKYIPNLEENFLPNNKKKILFLNDQFNGKLFMESPLLFEETFLKVAKAVKEIPEAKLIVKLHPGESKKAFEGMDEERYKFISRRIGVDVILIKHSLGIESLFKKTDTQRIVSASDCIVGVSSTVLLEAIALEKPIVIIRPRKVKKIIPYGEYNAAIETSTVKELKTAIFSVLNDIKIRKRLIENSRRMLRDYVDYRENSFERIARLVEDMIKN